MRTSEEPYRVSSGWVTAPRKKIPPEPSIKARSLSVRQGEQGALLRVLLFIVALSCLASGLCGNQRLERLVASLGLKGRKEDFADR